MPVVSGVNSVISSHNIPPSTQERHFIPNERAYDWRKEVAWDDGGPGVRSVEARKELQKSKRGNFEN